MEMKAYPRVYFELLIIGFSVVMGVGLSKAFLPIMASGMASTGSFVGLVTSARFFARSLIELPSGLMVHKLGRRTLLATGLLLGVVGSLICAFSKNIYMLILGMAVVGSASALFFTCSTILMFDLFKLEKRGGAVGTFQGMEFIGFFLGAPIGAILAGLVGFSNIFILTSVTFFGALLVALASRDLRKVDTMPRNGFADLSLKKTLGGLKKWNLVAVCSINLSRALVIQGIISTVLPLYLNDELNMSVEMIGLIFGARTAGLICATLICGYLSDQVGRKPLITGGLLISGVCAYLLSLISSFDEVVIVAIIDGVGSGFTYIPLTILMSELISPSLRSGALGLFRTFMDIGAVLGPIIFMFLYTMDNLSLPFWSASLLFFFNVAIFLLIKKR